MININKTITNQRTQNAIKQVGISFVFKALNIIVGFLYVPLLLNYLTQEKYGIWLTLTSILGWFSFFDIGLGNGLRNKLTMSLANQDFTLARKFVSTTYALLILIFGTVLVLFQALNHFIDWNKILNTYAVEKNELYLLTSIVFSFFLIRFVVHLIQVIYLAHQKSSFSDFINAAGNIISFIVVYILVKTSAQGNLMLLGGIISVIPVLLFIIASIYAYNSLFKSIKPSFKYVDFSYSKDLMGLGFKFFFLQVCAIIIFSTSSFFVAQYYGAKEVAVYNIAFKLFQMPIMVFSILLSPMWSAFTDAYVKNDITWLRNSIKKFNFISLGFSICIIILLFISPWVYKIWLGDSVIIPFQLSVAMAFYSILNVFISPYSNFINGTSKIKLTMSLTSVGIFVYLLLIALFANIFIDSTSVILAVASTSIIGLVVQSIQTHKILNGTAKGIWNK